MNQRRKRNTWLFIGSLLLAGILNLLSRTRDPVAGPLTSAGNHLILAGLVLFWFRSVRIRLVPSNIRKGVLAIAFLMLLYLLIRIFKYIIAGDDVLPARYAVYAYWIPQMLIPALFLMTCIRIRRGRAAQRKWNERLLLIPGFIFALLAVTNDLHRLIYVPRISPEEFVVESGTYSWGSRRDSR